MHCETLLLTCVAAEGRDSRRANERCRTGRIVRRTLRTRGIGTKRRAEPAGDFPWRPIAAEIAPTLVDPLADNVDSFRIAFATNVFRELVPTACDQRTRYSTISGRVSHFTRNPQASSDRVAVTLALDRCRRRFQAPRDPVGCFARSCGCRRIIVPFLCGFRFVRQSLIDAVTPGNWMWIGRGLGRIAARSRQELRRDGDENEAKYRGNPSWNSASVPVPTHARPTQHFALRDDASASTREVSALRRLRSLGRFS